MKTLKLLLFITLFQVVFILNGYAKIIDYIVATVDDKVITASELEKNLAPVIEHYKKTYNGKQLEDILNKARQDLLKEAIEEKILLLNAEEANIEVSEEEVDDSIEEFKQNFASSQEFHNELAGEGLTLADLRERIEQRIKVRRFMRFVIFKDINITEGEVQELYEENKESFFVPEQVKISQILVEPLEDGRTQEKVDDIFNRLESGEDFATLARLYSDGPHASKGGDLGFVHLEELHPDVRKALNGIEIGKYTDPIKTTAGIHIIKLEARKLPQYVPFSEMEDSLKKKLYDLKAGKAYDQWMEEARKNTEIVVFDAPII
jgi:peptidyl-prolyl cis-trans isomerase SurA